MQPGLYRNLDGPVGLVLTGPAATAVVLSPIEGGIEISEMGSDGGPPLATSLARARRDRRGRGRRGEIL
jgi:hypothetical protein